MKTKLIISALSVVLLLAGCSGKTESNNEPQKQISEETSGASDTEAETKASEDDTEKPAETDNNASAASKILQNVFSFGSIGSDEYGEGQAHGNSFIKGNIFCTDYSVTSDGEERFQLRLYDIDKSSLLAVIDIPDGWGTYEMISDTGEGSFCRYIISCSVFNEDSKAYDTSYKTVTVKNDLNYDIADGYTERDGAAACCGHNIAQIDPDIIDADSGEILIAGRNAESDEDFSGTRQMYYFTVDENRFVYRTLGDERLPGFGIYDFSKGAAVGVPDSENLIPLGVHGEKIYSVKTPWDGFGTELYVTDTETLETEFFMDCPFELEKNEYVEYAMPESGDYIALKYNPADEKAPALLYGIDPDTKECVFSEIPGELKYYSLNKAGGNRVTISNNNDTVLIAEITF